MKDLMVDIETLGTGGNAVITQIGACYFDLKTGDIGDKFLVNISIEDSMRKGFDVDGSTLVFWLDRFNNPTFLTNAKLVAIALTSFADFARRANTMWSHATFDAPILSNAFNKVCFKQPVHYRGHRDIRTLIDLAEYDLSKEDFKNRKTHDALEDAVFQAEYCSRAYKQLKEKLNAT